MRLEFDLSGVGLRVRGLGERLGRRLGEEWRAFVAEPTGDPVLDVEVRPGAGPEGFPAARYPKLMRAELATDRARFTTEHGQVEVPARGPARLELVPGSEAREYLTLTNLLRAALAWRVPSVGGVLLHAAGLVLEGRAFVLVGAAGAGKSTWARLGEAAGAHVVSDDLVLLRREARGFALLGAPFRSTHAVRFRRGGWPLAALLFPRHGSTAATAPVAPLLAKARVAANLTFVADAVDSDPRIAGLLDGLVAAGRPAELIFAEDPGFVELLRAWPGRGEAV